MPAVHFHTRKGFTLVELMMVLALVAMMAMVAAPRMLPILTLTEHENEARHLTGYGRAVMAQAVLNREALIVHVDMNTQEYWTTLAPQTDLNEDGTRSARNVNLSSYRERPDDETEFDRRFDDKEEDWVPEDKGELAQAAANINSTLKKQELGEEVEELKYSDEKDQETILRRQQDTMEEGFAVMNQNTLFARAKRIEHDHTLFDYEEDRLLAKRREEEIEELEQTAEPIEDPLLKRHSLIASVSIEAVFIGDEEFIRQDKETEKNVVEIELSPLGLDRPVSIELINEEAELLQVVWDPMTGNAFFKYIEEEEG